MSAGFELGLSETKASTLTTWPPPRPYLLFFYLNKFQEVYRRRGGLVVTRFNFYSDGLVFESRKSLGTVFM